MNQICVKPVVYPALIWSTNHGGVCNTAPRAGKNVVKVVSEGDYRNESRSTTRRLELGAKFMVGFMSVIGLGGAVESAYARPQDPSHRVPLLKVESERVMANVEPAGLVVYMNDEEDVILIDKAEEYKKGFVIKYDPKSTQSPYVICKTLSDCGSGEK